MSGVYAVHGSQAQNTHRKIIKTKEELLAEETSTQKNPPKTLICRFLLFPLSSPDAAILCIANAIPKKIPTSHHVKPIDGAMQQDLNRGVLTLPISGTEQISKLNYFTRGYLLIILLLAVVLSD